MVVHVLLQIHANVFLICGLDPCVKHVSGTFKNWLSYPLSILLIAVRILWTMDNNLDDFYDNFPGVAVNNPIFNFPGINGYGSCLYLNATASQSVIIYSPPFLNMAYTSFTLVAWIRATSMWSTTIGAPYGDNAIFGQMDQNVLQKSLHITLRNRKAYFGFFGDDTQGDIVLSPGIWYHVCILLHCNCIASNFDFLHLDGFCLWLSQFDSLYLCQRCIRYLW